MLVICRNGVGSGVVYGGGSTLIVPPSSTTSMRRSGRNLIAVGSVKPVARISFWNELVLATLTATEAESLALPEASIARAVSVCAPLGTVRESHASAYGAVVSGTPVSTP